MSSSQSHVSRPAFWPGFALCAGLVVLVTYVRLLAFQQNTIALAHGLPLLVCIWLRRRSLLWGMAAALLVLHGIKVAQLDRPELPLYVEFGCRAMNVLVLAGVIHVVIRLRQSLEQRNWQLEQANVDLARRRQEAEEASVRKTRFLASVSHDIRTPVNAITLLAELISRTADDPHHNGDIADLAQDLKDNAHGLVELVTDVLDIARFDTGGCELDVSEFALAPLLTAEVRRLAPLAESKGLRLELKQPAPGVQLRTDRIKLTRVLSNLLGNAIKFTDAGSVSVHVDSTAEGAVRVRVSDTGLGIPNENLPHIFDEFFQIKNPARDPSKGSGLGLAICKRLVEAIGAQLLVESQLDVGSTFTVLIPPSRTAGALSQVARVEPEAAASQSVGRLCGVRVLLVEDHEATRRATAQLLSSEGAIVSQVGTGRLAIQALEHDDTDVLLLDMMLPDMDGREVLRCLAAARPAALRGVLVITGDARESRRAESVEMGADGLILKPVSLEALVNEITRITRNPQGVGPAGLGKLT